MVAAALLILAPPGLPQESETGPADCMACHAEVVESFALSMHAHVPGIPAEMTCSGCHGDGSAHAASGDPADIRNLGKLSPTEASAVCLDCHEDQASQARFGTSLHETHAVGCNECHDPHGTSEAMLIEPSRDLCSSCHTNIAAQFDLARSHPLPEQGGCVGCHDPHGSANERMMRGFNAMSCTECHQEKEGPFVFGHDVTMVEGCGSCHQVHGSTNRHLLNHERQNNLCYTCHPGSQTPSFHSFNRFLGEKCTACHTAIHGSNTNPYFLEE